MATYGRIGVATEGSDADVGRGQPKEQRASVRTSFRSVDVKVEGTSFSLARSRRKTFRLSLPRAKVRKTNLLQQPR